MVLGVSERPRPGLGRATRLVVGEVIGQLGEVIVGGLGLPLGARGVHEHDVKIKIEEVGDRGEHSAAISPKASSRKSIAAYAASSVNPGQRSIATRSATQPVAASFEPGSQARCETVPPERQRASDASLLQRLHAATERIHRLEHDNQQLRDALARALGERRAADILGHPARHDTPNGKPAKLVGPC